MAKSTDEPAAPTAGRPAGGAEPAAGAEASRAGTSGARPLSRPARGPADDDPRSTVAVLGDIFTEMQELLRKELELAKLEITEAVGVRLQAAAAGAAAGLLALFALGFLGVTIAKAIDVALPEWVAWALTTLLFLIIAGVAGLIAKKRATAVPMAPERTKRSIEENVEWAKHQLRH